MAHAIRLPALALVVFLTIGSLPAREPAQDKPDAARPAAGRWQRVHKLIQGHIDRHEIAGAVILVQQRRKPLLMEAFGKGDVESNTPMRRGTIFRLASMTKPITSVAVMMLVDEGKLRLDDPLS